jgi:membrane associated rhomboid family serine protease
MSFFAQLPQVTKNLLILNILMFIMNLVLLNKGIDLNELLGAYFLTSPNFEPYQVVTYMFMHDNGNFMHILVNMLMLVMFGAHLERVWGAKRFFLFYVSCAVGAYLLYNGLGVYQMLMAKAELKGIVDFTTVNNIIYNSDSLVELNANVNSYLYRLPQFTQENWNVLQQYIQLGITPMVGASGALFGIMTGFAILFPNTELMLLFPPIPIKAKYLIGAYLLFEIYNSIMMIDDSVAHLAHVGGAIVGIVFVLYWRKKDRNHFW